MYTVKWLGESTWAVIFVPNLPKERHIAVVKSVADGEMVAKALNEAAGL